MKLVFFNDYRLGVLKKDEDRVVDMDAGAGGDSPASARAITCVGSSSGGTASRSGWSATPWTCPASR